MSTTATPAAETSTVVQKAAAEALGTYVLVLLGCGVLAISQQGESIGGLTSVALTFGFVYAALIYAFGRISGGHFNPAVTVGAALGGRIAWREVGIYVGAQLGGAILAGLTLFVLFQGYEGFEAEGSMGQNFFGDDFNGYAWWAAFLLELLLTALLVYVILAVTDSRNEHPALAPLAIGLALVALTLFAVGHTGASFNPARSIGSALFAGGDSIIQLWLFILAPLLGAAIAGLTYPLLFGRGSEQVPGSGLSFSRGPKGAHGGPDAYQQQWNQNDPYAQYGAGGYAQPGQPQGQPQGYPQGEHQQPYQQQSWEQAPQPAAGQPAPWEPQAQQWQPEQPAQDPAAGQAPQWDQQGYPQPEQQQPQQWEQQWDRPAGQPQAGQPFSPPPVNPAGPDDDEGRTQIRPSGH